MNHVRTCLLYLSRFVNDCSSNIYIMFRLVWTQLRSKCLVRSEKFTIIVHKSPNPNQLATSTLRGPEICHINVGMCMS